MLLLYINDFDEDLKYSLEAKKNEDFNNFYRLHFPVLKIKPITFEEYPQAQLNGIDKLIYLTNGKIIRIDEKVRRTAYPDYALELISNTKTGALGWLYKCKSDYIMYYKEPIKEATILPYPLLVSVWVKNKDIWLKEYEIRTAHNKGYDSLFIPIPSDVLLYEIKNQLCQSYAC